LTGTPNIVRGSVIFPSSSDNGRFISHLFSLLLLSKHWKLRKILSYGHSSYTKN
jgi:hypothetical protein